MMKILLIGEYSRLHLSLAEGLRTLGNEVTLVSDGDSFKNYDRDIDITRKSSRIVDTASCLLRVYKLFSKFKDYDVVQLINPCFTTLNVRVNRYLFRLLRKNNRKIFLGAFGDDSVWVRASMDKNLFKYSEFQINGVDTNLQYTNNLKQTWTNSLHEKLNIEIADNCDGIIACLYEYYQSYKKDYGHKLAYIPLPFNTDIIPYQKIDYLHQKIQFFIGVNKHRKEYKGTDVMQKALLRLQTSYPDKVDISYIESVNYDDYTRIMKQSHIVLDQLYSHSPAMNGLLAMTEGKILVGGGEPEIYDILDEKSLRPIINVYPSEDDVYNQLEKLILEPSKLIELSAQSREFVLKHHHYVKVAQQYLDFWTKK